MTKMGNEESQKRHFSDTPNNIETRLNKSQLNPV